MTTLTINTYGRSPDGLTVLPILTTREIKADDAKQAVCDAYRALDPEAREATQAVMAWDGCTCLAVLDPFNFEHMMARHPAG